MLTKVNWKRYEMHIEKESNDLETNFSFEDYLTGQKYKLCNHMRVSNIIIGKQN
jgi:hypothetical protein